MRWVTDIILALRSYGGNASNQQIYKWIERNRNQPLATNWKSTVRATLQSYSKISSQYRPGNPDFFANVEKGWWRLNTHADLQSVPQKESDALIFALSHMTAEEIQSASSDAEFLIKLVQRASELQKVY